MSQPADIAGLARRLEANEVAAWRAMYQAPSNEIAAQMGIGCADEHGALLIWNRSAPVFLFNRLLALGVFEPASVAALDALLARARAEGSRAGIQVAPAALTSNLAALLDARGLARAPAWLMHCRALDGPLPAAVAPPGYRVERVAPAAAAAWCDALLAAWGFPAWAAAGALALVLPLHQHPDFVCFAAIEQATGQTVGGGALFVSGGVAGLYADGVRPEHRHHDLQDALIAFRLEEGRRLGCDIASSQTLANHPAQHNMAQAGFAVVYERANYVMPK
jgi:hypothetical protein